MVERKCIGCGEIKNRNDLIKITKQNDSDNIVISRDTKTFGRSIYLCYDNQCIETAFKKNKIQKALKSPISAELKGKILNEL